MKKKDEKPETFTDAVSALVARCKTAYAIDKAIVIDPKGAHSLALMLESMAMRLDRFVALEKEAEKKKPLDNIQ